MINKLSFIVLFIGLYVSALSQVDITLASRFNVSGVSGFNSYVIQGQLNDCLSRWSSSDVAVNDSLYFIEGSDLVVLAVTNIDSVVLGVVYLKATDPLSTGIVPSGGEAIIVRPTPNMKLPPFTCNARPDLQSMVQNRLAHLIDGGLSATITSFTRHNSLLEDTLRIIEKGVTHNLLIPNTTFVGTYNNIDLSSSSLISWWKDYDNITVVLGVDVSGTSRSDVLLPNPVGNDQYLGKVISVYSIDEHPVHTVRVHGGGFTLINIGSATPEQSRDIPNRYMITLSCIKDVSGVNWWVYSVKGIDYDPDAQAGGDLNGALSWLQINAGAIVTADLADTTVTFAKVQNMNTNKLLGRSTAGRGNVEEITVGSNLVLTGGVLSAVGGDSTIVSGEGTVGRIPVWELSPTNLGDSYMDVVDSITHARGGMVTYNKDNSVAALDINGALKTAIHNISINTALDGRHNTLYVDCTAGAIALTVGSVAAYPNWEYKIRKVDDTSNPIIVYGDFGSSGQKVITTNMETILVKNNAVKWFIN